jgi:hypothetical protein
MKGLAWSRGTLLDEATGCPMLQTAGAWYACATGKCRRFRDRGRRLR